MLTKVGRKYVALDLISTLLVQPAALSLRSNIGVGLLRDDITSLDAHLTSDRLDITIFSPLLKLVVNRKSDAEVWTAVYDLVLQVSLRPNTPPRPSSYAWGGNPFKSMPLESVKETLKCELNSGLEFNHPNFIASFFADDRQVEDAANAVFNKCCEGKAPMFNHSWHSWEDGNVNAVKRSLEAHINSIMTLLDSANIKPPSKRHFISLPITPLPEPEKPNPDVCLVSRESTVLGIDRPTQMPSWVRFLSLSNSICLGRTV